MSYKVDFDGIDSAYNSSQQGIQSVSTQLQTLSAAIGAVINSQNMEGVGADAIKEYFRSVHGTIIETLGELLTIYIRNFLLYKNDYQTNIDKKMHSVICEDELLTIKSRLKQKKDEAEEIDYDVRRALGSIKDIFSANYRGIDGVLDVYVHTDVFLAKLDADIQELEDTHSKADFTETENLLDTLRIFINEHISYERTYKDDFSLDKLVVSESFKELYAASIAVNKELDEKLESIETALENENERVQILEEEYEERQKQVTAQKWIVTGACVVGSIAIIAATGGAAAPLVAGAVAGASGAITAGFSNVADQYVESGSTAISDYNLTSCGKDALIGGITGFVTGAVGAGIGGAISSGLGNTAVGSTLLNSSNTAVRVGTGAVIGAASEVGSGIVSRGAGTLISTGGDLEAAKESAFDLNNIAYDATIGGITGGISNAKKPVGKEITLDELDGELLETKPKNSPNPEKWLDEKGGKIFVDGNDVWTYQSSDGTAVCYSDGYPDFKRAGLVTDTYTTDGFDTRNHSVDINEAIGATGKGGTGSGMTWHHNQDGTTLELVPTEYHELFRHRGGFSIAKGG